MTTTKLGTLAVQTISLGGDILADLYEGDSALDATKAVDRGIEAMSQPRTTIGAVCLSLWGAEGALVDKGTLALSELALCDMEGITIADLRGREGYPLA